jgi:hypothetical protein
MSEKTYECGICACDLPEPRSITIDGSPLCKKCVLESIIPKFYEALKFEAKYPVKWGRKVVLVPQGFVKYFDDYDAFLKKWQKRLIEYTCLGKERLYCKVCNSFLGRLPVFDRSEDVVRCDKCYMDVCGNCGAKNHKARDCTAEPGDNPFKDFKDTKECPACGTAMFLAEGCNQIDCGSCDARFCWVCLELNPKRDHWNRGKQCPKYKQPGDPNASWIDPEADHQMDVENPEITLPVELFQYVPPAPSDWVLEALAVLAWLPLNIEERHLLPPGGPFVAYKIYSTVPDRRSGDAARQLS